MVNIFAFGRKKESENEKDLYSNAIYTFKESTSIRETQALKIPAVKGTIELISNSIATLPIYLYREVNELDISKVIDSRINRLNHASNGFDTAQVLKKKIVKDYLLHGKAYLYKKDTELYYLEASNVEVVEFSEDGFTVSEREFIFNGYKRVTLDENEIIVIDSGTNGVLVDGENILSQALNQIEYSSALLKNGALPLGLIKAAARLTETSLNRLRTSFENLYSGATKAGRTMILEEGLEYESISLSPDELQLTESNKQLVSDIAKLFNIPESMINSAANKYNSLEQNSVHFLRNTLAPIITALENAFDKSLLTESEKQNGYFFRFDTSEILRTTEESKIKVAAEAFHKGLMSYNEVRTKLDLPNIKEDYTLLSIGNVVKYANGQMVFLNLGPQTNQTEGENLSNEDGNENDTNIIEI